MKKILTATSILLIAAVLNSCGYKAKIEVATAKSDSLQLVLDERNQTINNAFDDIEQIATSLVQIAAREKIVTTSSDGEITQSAKKRISDNLVAIDELLQKNRAAINRLSVSARQLKEANLNIESLDKLVNSLELQIQLKDSMLSQMNTHLAHMKLEVSGLQELNKTLSDQNESLESTVADQTIDLNTIHWIVNTEKELQKRGIVDKKGFIGRTLILKNVADTNGFTTGDRRNINSIAIGQKGVKIVSSHPKDSYELISGEKNSIQELIIKDKEAFWKTSKILVVSHRK